MSLTDVKRIIVMHSKNGENFIHVEITKEGKKSITVNTDGESIELKSSDYPENCQICGNKFRPTRFFLKEDEKTASKPYPYVIVHHTSYFNVKKDDLRFLCFRCHNKLTALITSKIIEWSKHTEIYKEMNLKAFDELKKKLAVKMAD